MTAGTMSHLATMTTAIAVWKQLSVIGAKEVTVNAMKLD